MVLGLVTYLFSCSLSHSKHIFRYSKSLNLGKIIEQRITRFKQAHGYVTVYCFNGNTLNAIDGLTNGIHGPPSFSGDIAVSENIAESSVL